MVGVRCVVVVVAGGECGRNGVLEGVRCVGGRDGCE